MLLLASQLQWVPVNRSNQHPISVVTQLILLTLGKDATAGVAAGSHPRPILGPGLAIDPGSIPVLGSDLDPCSGPGAGTSPLLTLPLLVALSPVSLKCLF